MKEKLIHAINTYVIKVNRHGRMKLCLEAGISLASLDKLLGTRPTSSRLNPKVIYKVARTVGFAEEEALEMAHEISSNWPTYRVRPRSKIA